MTSPGATCSSASCECIDNEARRQAAHQHMATPGAVLPGKRVSARWHCTTKKRDEDPHSPRQQQVAPASLPQAVHLQQRGKYMIVNAVLAARLRPARCVATAMDA